MVLTQTYSLATSKQVTLSPSVKNNKKRLLLLLVEDVEDVVVQLLEDLISLLDVVIKLSCKR